MAFDEKVKVAIYVACGAILVFETARQINIPRVLKAIGAQIVIIVASVFIAVLTRRLGWPGELVFVCVWVMLTLALLMWRRNGENPLSNVLSNSPSFTISTPMSVIGLLIMAFGAFLFVGNVSGSFPTIPFAGGFLMTVGALVYGLAESRQA